MIVQEAVSVFFGEVLRGAFGANGLSNTEIFNWLIYSITMKSKKKGVGNVVGRVVRDQRREVWF